jgi:hypothetical protein
LFSDPPPARQPSGNFHSGKRQKEGQQRIADQVREARRPAADESEQAQNAKPKNDAKAEERRQLANSCRALASRRLGRGRRCGRVGAGSVLVRHSRLSRINITTIASNQALIKLLRKKSLNHIVSR